MKLKNNNKARIKSTFEKLMRAILTIKSAIYLLCYLNKSSFNINHKILAIVKLRTG